MKTTDPILHPLQTAEERARKPFSYPEVGASRGAFPVGYDHDSRKVLLGKGEVLFHKAADHILHLRHFPPTWTRIAFSGSLRKDTEIQVSFRLFGRWWHNACRVVYLIDMPRRKGFAYGTLSNHVECGEEIFEVELDADNQVWFHIRAFSRPARWYTRLGYPIARWYQRRFVRDAFRHMLDLTNP